MKQALVNKCSFIAYTNPPLLWGKITKRVLSGKKAGNPLAQEAWVQRAKNSFLPVNCPSMTSWPFQQNIYLLVVGPGGGQTWGHLRTGEGGSSKTKEPSKRESWIKSPCLPLLCSLHLEQEFWMNMYYSLTIWQAPYMHYFNQCPLHGSGHTVDE